MSQGNEFKYDTLFAKSAPKQPPRAATVSRAKYDFAVAYPDPESLPLEELVESQSNRIILPADGEENTPSYSES